MGKLLLWLWLGSLVLWAETLAVVVAKTTPIPPLDQDAIKAIFLKKQLFINGIALKPINLAPSEPLRQAFETKVLQMDKERLARYWMREHYRGHRPPYRVDSIRAMVQFVIKVEGAIGYLPQKSVTPKMQILYRVPL